MKNKKEQTMLEIAKKKNRGWEYIDNGKGTKLIIKEVNNGKDKKS